MTEQVSRWDVFEYTVEGPSEGNPYLDVTFGATFSLANRDVAVPGFYDGDGLYKVRFCPDTEGEWRITTTSSAAALSGRESTLTVGPARPGVHGPVRIRNQFHFAYADGKPYLPFGTTCYAWTHQSLELQEQTLKTLADAPFNKIRMGVFPKDYIYNTNEPLHDIYEKRADGSHDMDRPNFEGFRHFEAQIARLMEMGIEADIILFHPYDRWGYCTMTEEQDFRYLRYIVARIAAYRNVWWSLANEYDFLLDTKPMERWDRFFQIIEEGDHLRHLKSIHNGDVDKNYDHRKPWVDHVCIQNWDVKKTIDWRQAYGKPVINDEPEYEGNIPKEWGNIHGHELVDRYWLTLCRGGYIGHGETFMHEDDELWWAKGGVLRGEAPARIAFLRDILEDDAEDGLTPLLERGTPFKRVSAVRDGDVRYIYFSEHQPMEWALGLPEEDGDWEIDLIDVWNMTITPLEKAPLPRVHPQRITGGSHITNAFTAAFGLKLPGKPYLAVRIRPRRMR
ncbi:DUF5060 domain-containing protein [Neorhizobium sp. NPDC001467]|uniref:DUF5060 domain-containing protein n=1 Tax=Neorhizobium sp. NPDC001467 TaxID=3390595 RepID=UPI003D030A9F